MPAWSINRSVRTPLLLLAFIELAAIFFSVYVSAWVVYGSLSNCEGELGTLSPKGAMFSAVMFTSLVATGLYNFHQRAFFHEILARVGVAFAGGAVILSAIFYVGPVFYMPIKMGGVSAATAITILVLIRLFFHRNADDNVFRHRTLVYGSGRRSAAIAEMRRRADRRGFYIVGNVPAPGDASDLVKSDSASTEVSLLTLAQELRADEIVVAMDDRRGNLPIRELLDCKLRGISIIDLVEFLERETGKIRVDLVNPGWLIFSPGFRYSRARFAMKRFVDIVVSLIGIVIGWPLMVLVSLAIKFEEGISAPVLYRQERVGLNGDVFKVLKFRSMRVDAEADGEAIWAAENDPRTTRTGSFIRKCRLDELPQIINVLKGEMSLVGPRPERPEFVSSLQEKIPYYSERHSVKPGVTGWAQLRYTYGSSEEDTIQKLQYDLYYIKNQSILLDLIIILQTVEVVLWGKGSR